MTEQPPKRSRFRFQAGILSLLLFISTIAVWLAEYQADQQLEGLKVQVEESKQLSDKYGEFLETVQASIEATP